MGHKLNFQSKAGWDNICKKTDLIWTVKYYSSIWSPTIYQPISFGSVWSKNGHLLSFCETKSEIIIEDTSQGKLGVFRARGFLSRSRQILAGLYDTKDSGSSLAGCIILFYINQLKLFVIVFGVVETSTPFILASFFKAATRKQTYYFTGVPFLLSSTSWSMKTTFDQSTI